MKKRFLGFLLLPLLITGCNQATSSSSQKVDEGSYNTNSINVARKSGAIGGFNLLTPGNNFVTNTGFTFAWEEASNSDYYELEIASTLNFISDDEDEVYVRESNLSFARFDLTYSLPKKDIIYYWRVTAINRDNKKKCNENGQFKYEALDVGEIPIEIEDADDWVLHKEGSYADIEVDRNNFFGNNKNSLVIRFDKEHTLQGISKSDGWIVVTKSEDRELYGTDAFYFNFYYSGHDSTVLVRVLDYDGEYWHKQVQISNNAKQTVVVKYQDFTLRTAGTNVYNRKFDWEHIRYFEIVFERTFGDGICIFSDIKAVKFDDYKFMFMDKMDFKSTDPKDWTYENFDFRNDMAISEDGSEITLNYRARNAETNPNGFSGYGFQNINVYKHFVEGDALRMKVKYTGSSSNAIFYFRVLEEDNDRWQFKTPFSYFIKDDYKELLIPLTALQRTDYMTGDGAKQFDFVQKFNVGLADNYATGSISIKDLEVVKLDDIYESRVRTVGADGCIENFNDYNIYTEIYTCWTQSAVNKDEAMKLDSIHKTGGNRNTYCAEFDYKADMEMAVYQIYLNTTAVQGKNALSLWLKDNSQKPSDIGPIDYLDPNDIAAEMTIQLTLDSGEWYRYVIPKLNKEWHNYTISFSDFVLNNEADLFDKPKPLTSDHIIHMAFGFKYLYYTEEGVHYPTYAIANPVYLDEMYFVNSASTSITEISGAIKEDADDPNKITVDTMEAIADNDAVFDYWSYGSELDYNSMTLSNDVSSIGGQKSMKMHYKGSTSVSYARSTLFANTVTAKGFSIDVKGDSKATLYINLNWRSGTTIYKMRYALNLTSQGTNWKHYELGFNNFKDINGSTKSISQSDAKAIESISFGIVNGDGSESDIYVDNIRLLKNVGYSVNTVDDID